MKILAISAPSPHTLVTIFWEVELYSGSTTVTAWAGQGEIERLEAAGYTILSVEIAK